MGVFNKVFAALAAKGGKPDQLMIDAFPKAKALLGDRGYDAGWFRAALVERGLPPASRQRPIDRRQSPQKKLHILICAAVFHHIPPPSTAPFQ